MLKAEYQGNEGFLQRDSVEHKGYAEAQSTDRREGKERDGAIPDWAIGVLPGVRCFSVPLQTKDSQQRDTLVSSTTTSPCTYAVEPPCTGRYARWCERSAL